MCAALLLPDTPVCGHRPPAGPPVHACPLQRPPLHTPPRVVRGGATERGNQPLWAPGRNTGDGNGGWADLSVSIPPPPPPPCPAGSVTKGGQVAPIVMAASGKFFLHTSFLHPSPMETLPLEVLLRLRCPRGTIRALPGVLLRFRYPG